MSSRVLACLFGIKRFAIIYKVLVWVFAKPCLVYFKLYRLFIWGKIVEPKIGSRVPSLLKLIADIIVYFTAILALAKVVFNEDVTGLLATFSVVSFAIVLR